MIESIKELFTAYYENGKIVGCRKYSMAWHHEYRHHIQMQNKVLNKIWLWLPYLTGCSGLVMLWLLITIRERYILIIGGACIIPISIFLLLLEIDAYIYSLIKMMTK